jgi:hypothetical protein
MKIRTKSITPEKWNSLLRFNCLNDFKRRHDIISISLNLRCSTTCCVWSSQLPQGNLGQRVRVGTAAQESLNLLSQTKFLPFLAIVVSAAAFPAHSYVHTYLNSSCSLMMQVGVFALHMGGAPREAIALLGRAVEARRIDR